MFHWPKCSCVSTKTKLLEAFVALVWPAVCCPVVRQNCSLLATAHDCATGLSKLLKKSSDWFISPRQHSYEACLELRQPSYIMTSYGCFQCIVGSGFLYRKSTCGFPRRGPNLESDATWTSAGFGKGCRVSFQDFTIFSTVAGAQVVGLGPERARFCLFTNFPEERSSCKGWDRAFTLSLSVWEPDSISCLIGWAPKSGKDTLLVGLSWFFASFLLIGSSPDPLLLSLVASAPEDSRGGPGADGRKMTCNVRNGRNSLVTFLAWQEGSRKELEMATIIYPTLPQSNPISTKMSQRKAGLAFS